MTNSYVAAAPALRKPPGRTRIPAYNDLTAKLTTNPHAWVNVPLAAIPGETRKTKQSRVLMAMEKRGLRVQTKSTETGLYVARVTCDQPVPEDEVYGQLYGSLPPYCAAVVNYLFPPLAPRDYGWICDAYGGTITQAPHNRDLYSGPLLSVDPELPARMGKVEYLYEWLPRYMDRRPPCHLPSLLRQLKEQFPGLTGLALLRVVFQLRLDNEINTPAYDVLAAAIAEVYGVKAVR